MRIKLYLDEDVPLAFAQALSNRGVDVLTTQKASNLEASDTQQLIFAIKERRAIFTHNNKDYVLLHKEYLRCKKEHHGIILSDQLSIGVLLKRFMKLWFALNEMDMKCRLEFLRTGNRLNLFLILLIFSLLEHLFMKTYINSFGKKKNKESALDIGHFIKNKTKVTYCSLLLKLLISL